MTQLTRRDALASLAVGATIVGCGDSGGGGGGAAAGTGGNAGAAGSFSTGGVAGSTATGGSTSAAGGTGATGGAPQVPACVLSPEQTAGPFYFDPMLERQQISEDRSGRPLKVTFQVLRVSGDSCEPAAGAIVDAWHADAAGLYSGYQEQGDNADIDTSGLTFLRGHQITDDEGKVEFTTIYPGWYPGRATHIHFKVRDGDVTYVTSQMYFPDDINAAAQTGEPYDARGSAATTNDSDGIFRSTTNIEALVAEASADGDGYVATLTIGIAAT